MTDEQASEETKTVRMQAHADLRDIQEWIDSIIENLNDAGAFDEIPKLFWHSCTTDDGVTIVAYPDIEDGWPEEHKTYISLVEIVEMYLEENGVHPTDRDRLEAGFVKVEAAIARARALYGSE